MRIVDGRVQADEITYDLNGAVTPGGGIHVTVEEKGRSATGTGKLTRDSGHGQWRTVPQRTSVLGTGRPQGAGRRRFSGKSHERVAGPPWAKTCSPTRAHFFG